MHARRVDRILNPGIAALLYLFAALAAQANEVGSVRGAGEAYYREHCAVCHGSDGRGEGVFSEVLTKRPPDLTTIAQRRGGAFPSLEVAEYIEGARRPEAHGSSDMPLWGSRFREPSTAVTQQGDDNALRGRVYLIVEYLRSLQLGIKVEIIEGAEAEGIVGSGPRNPRLANIPGLAELGREQYLINCSSCHGPAGRGDGPVRRYLDPAPADLTGIAKRRGGKFSGVEIAEIIDGRSEVALHGARDMPVWGVYLGKNRTGMLGQETAVRGDIHLLVEYLRSIQEN